MRNRRAQGLRTAAIAMTLGALYACGSRSAAVVPPVGAPAKVPAKTAKVQFSVTVPRLTTGRVRAPRYVSVATQSASIVVSPAGGSPGTPVVVNCTNVCSGQIAAPVGSDAFTISLFDAPNGGGNVLSTGSLTQTIVIDLVNTVNVTFNGVVKSLAVTLNPASVATGTASTVAVTANALDASGNVIVGPGGFADANGNAVTITLTDSDTSGATKLSTTTLPAPATGITLSYNGNAIPNPSIAAAAPGVTPASASLTLGASGCPAPGPADLYLATNTGLSAYRLGASGNDAPLSTLSPPSRAVAVDPQGLKYDAIFNAQTSSTVIEVFCSVASGNAAPQRTIVPAAGNILTSIALDSSGNLYAANFLGSILEYAPGAGAAGAPAGNQATTPAKRELTGLGFYPQQIGVDGPGNIYAGNGVGITVYGPSANGNAPASSGEITSLAANLTQPFSPAVDAAGDVFALYGDFRANRCTYNTPLYTCQAVAISANGSSGPPAHILTFTSGKQLGSGGPNAQGIPAAGAIAADAGGSVYVLSNYATQGGASTAIAVYPPGSQDGDATPSRVINDNGSAFFQALSIAVDGSGYIYVTNRAANAANSNIVVYGPAGTAPVRTFGNGALTAPVGVAVAADGTAYVAQSNSGVLNVYAPGASGTQPPSRTLNIAATFPSAYVAGLAVDATGIVYVRPANLSGTVLPLVAAYGPGASGSQAPVRTFTDPFAVLDSSGGLAADALGNVYVAGTYSNTIGFYPASSTGTVSPTRRLSYAAPSTRGWAVQVLGNHCYAACTGASAYVDGKGNLYVSSFVSDSILVYAPGATTPSRSIIGPSTQLLFPQSMSVDAAGNLFVQSLTGTVVFGPTANGDATPLRVLNAQGVPAIGPGP